MALAVSHQDMAMRLQSAGSGKGLTVKVVAELEQGLAGHKTDGHSFDPRYLQSLEPALEVLIRMTEEMVAELKSRSAENNELGDEAVLDIGQFNNAIEEIQKSNSDLDARLEGEIAAQKLHDLKIHEVQGVIDRNKQEIREAEDLGIFNRYLVLSFVIPFHLEFKLARGFVRHLIRHRHVRELQEKTQAAVCEVHSTEAHLNASKANSKELMREKSVLQSKIVDLEASKSQSERTKKVHDARFAGLADVILYYRLLSDSVKNVESNLDFPTAQMEKLYSPRELVLYTGDVRQGTLKDALIQLGDDYDQCIPRSQKCSLAYLDKFRKEFFCENCQLVSLIRGATKPLE